MYIYIYVFGLVVRVFANGLGDLGSIPGRVIPKTLKMVLDTSLLNTKQYKIRIKGKVEQSSEILVVIDYGHQLYLLYIFNSMDAYPQPLVSCRVYTTIIRRRKLYIYICVCVCVCMHVYRQFQLNSKYILF